MLLSVSNPWTNRSMAGWVCYAEAATVFTRLLRKDPGNSGARDGLEQTLRARSRRKG